MHFFLRASWACILLLLTLPLACLAQVRAPGEVPTAKAGVLDLVGWDFERDGSVLLAGEWILDWQQFGAPRLPAGQRESASVPAEVPGAWHGLVVGGTSLGSSGYGTYRLDIPCTSAKGLSLFIPNQHSAMRLHVNGREVAHQGVPGTRADNTRPAVGQQYVPLGDVACPLQITAHVSNFDHRRGGLVRAMELGSTLQMQNRRELGLVRDTAALVGVGLMGVLPILFFIWRRKERAPLYLGLYCLSTAVVIALSGERVLLPLLAPLGWNIYLKLLFANLWAGLALFALFVHSLYPVEFREKPRRAIQLVGVAAVLMVVLTPARIFTLAIPAQVISSVLLGCYLVYVLLKAGGQGRLSPYILLGGMAAIVIAITHDTLYFRTLQSGYWTPIGILIFAFAPGITLARRMSRALAAEELRAIEQRGRTNLLVRATKAGLLDWDAIANVVSYSDRYKEMLGYPADAEASALPPFNDLVHPDEREHVRQSFLEELRDRSVRSTTRYHRSLDYRMRRADGTYIWVHAEGIALIGDDRKTLRFICSFIDISDSKRHEIAMSNQAKFIADLFDTVPIGMALRDTESRYLVVNKAWEQYVGVRREEVIGKTLRERAPANEVALIEALDREVLAMGPGATVGPRENTFRGRRYAQSRTAMADSEGKIIGVLIASIDIHEKYLAEQALAVERERLQLLVRATKAGFGDWDAQSDAVSYTARFKEMLGYPGDTDTSAWPSIFDMMHPDDREASREQFRKMIRRRNSSEPEQEPGEAMSYRLRRADGSYIWIHAEGISQVDEQGRTKRFITSYLDVTAFHEQEEALRAQVELTRTEQRRLDLVVRGARVGIVDWDGKTHETYYSPRFREIRGYAPDADTTDWPDYFKVMIHPEDQERVVRRWVPFIRGKGPEGPHGEFYSPEEYRLLRADGSYVWVQVSGIAVRDETGFVLRWIAAIIDISERRAQDQALRASLDQVAAQAAQLEHQNEALLENVRLREEVERIARHDIKTPLNSIIAVPRLLREERRLTKEADELLGIVERAGYRILSMVNLSLDLYKMEQGSYIFRPDAVDLVELFDKVAVDIHSHAASKNVNLRVKSSATRACAWAEELLCYSLIANLLKNAVEASPEGAVVTVSIEAIEAIGATEDSRSVALHIHNVGVVPPSIRENFFVKYATAGKASGTGLGTYSARLMARVQDGDVTMRTSAAEGTTLSVVLRAAPAGKVPAIVRHASERQDSQPLALASLPALKILLVDDDEFNLLIVRRFLPCPPLKVFTAFNGRVALEMAMEEAPDVVFMDLDMPIMGGLEAIGKLREQELSSGRKRCFAVVLSSHDDEETRVRCLASGFDHYLTKPVTRDLIQQTLLDHSAATRPAGLAGTAPQAQMAPSTVLVDPDMADLMTDFLASRHQILDAMDQAVVAGDQEGVRRGAHQLAGSLAVYGFQWGADASRSLELQAQTLAPAQAQEIIQAVRLHLQTAAIVVRPEE
jgi:PAS domain S-box-containing protein